MPDATVAPIATGGAAAASPARASVTATMDVGHTTTALSCVS
jgi:hypothetical protein